MKHFLTILMTFFAVFIVSSISTEAAQQGETPFGFMTPQEVIEEAKKYLNSSDITNYYYVSYNVHDDYTSYRVCFFRSDTVNFDYGTELINDNNRGIRGRPGYSNCELQYLTSTQELRGTAISYYDTNNTLNLWQLISAPITYYNNVALIATNAPQYNVEPIQNVQDGYFFSKDGFSFVYGVYCTPASTFIDIDQGDGCAFYTTDLYYFDFSIMYKGQKITHRELNAQYWRIQKSPHIKAVEEGDSSAGALDYLPLFTWYGRYTTETWGRGIRFNKSTAPTALNMLTDFSKGEDYRSVNYFSINKLLEAFKKDYPDITLNDLYTDISLDFVSRGDLKSRKTLHCDYSSLHDSGVVPPSDDGTERERTGGDEDPAYFGGLSGQANNINIDGLNAIQVPSFSLEQAELDQSSLEWFGWFVEWWYSSPFGMIAIVALTFLIIRTIIW